MTSARNATGRRDDLVCPECGALMVLRDSRYGLFYSCSKYPECIATHGAYKSDGRPLGKPANKKTRGARIAAHAEFDRLWKYEGWSRESAYHWMQKVLGLNRRQAHIGKLDKKQCEALVWLVKNKIGL